jgi:hypothetical protein
MVVKRIWRVDMSGSIRVRPRNSLVLVSDAKGGEIPPSMSGSLIASTKSCIAVGCLMEDDGETELVLGPMDGVNPGEPAVFDGRLATPTRKVTIRSVLGEILLEQLVPHTSTRVRIWASDSSEPDRVIVGVD